MPRNQIVSVPPGIMASCAVMQQEHVSRPTYDFYARDTAVYFEMSNITAAPIDVDVKESSRRLEEEFPGYLDEIHAYILRTTSVYHLDMKDGELSRVLSSLGIEPPKVLCDLLIETDDGLTDANMSVDIGPVIQSLTMDEFNNLARDLAMVDADGYDHEEPSLVLSSATLLNKYAGNGPEVERAVVEGIISDAERDGHTPRLLVDDIRSAWTVMEKFRPAATAELKSVNPQTVRKIERKAAEEVTVDFVGDCLSPMR